MTSSTEKTRAERIEKWTAKVAAEPESADAHMRLGTTLLGDNKSKDAEHHLRKAVELDSKCVPALINLGGVLLSRWDFKGCVEMNSKAIEADPSAISAHYNKGLGHLYLVEKQEMVECFRNVVKLDENHAGGHYYLAVGLLALGQDDEAKKETTIALGLGYKPEPAFLKALDKADKRQEAAMTNNSKD